MSKIHKAHTTRDVMGMEYPDTVLAPGASLGDALKVRTHGRDFNCVVCQVTTPYGEGICEVRAKPVSQRIQSRFDRLCRREEAVIAKADEYHAIRLARQGATMFDAILDNTGHTA